MRIGGYNEIVKDQVCYWHTTDGWLLYLPQGESIFDGDIGNLRAHTVTQHQDGTISASPSILITSPHKLRRHGFLVKGNWEPCPDDLTK